METFTLTNPHGQLVVFVDATAPFSVWTGRHGDQGFVFRVGTIAFKTPDCVRSQISVRVAKAFDPKKSQAARIIRLPLEVSDGHVTIATTVHERDVNVPDDAYAVYFELMPTSASDPETTIVLLTLVAAKGAKANPKVLRADDDLSLKGELLLTGEGIPG
jgi:hypothetical protein